MKKNKIDIICPLYNAESYIVPLNNSLMKQKKVNINSIKYVLTESSDSSENILKKNKIKYKKIKKEEFSHSLTREEVAFKSKADILCFISQDIVIEDDLWLYNLTKNIVNGKCEAAYSRQISKYNNIEKYTREFNYNNISIIKSKEDIDNLGLKTFFFSDAASAINTEVFKELNGYDQKKLPINEDMYFAYKLITNGYRISYEADSVVFHSHKFKLKDVYNRYKLTGKFFKENSYIDEYGTTGSGKALALYILKRAIKDLNIKVIFRWPFDMAARLLGMKIGKSVYKREI